MSVFIFFRRSNFLKLSSCLIVLLAARIKRTFPSLDRFTGAHLPDNFLPTIFCQFPEMIPSLVSSSPIPQSSQTFSTKFSMGTGCRDTRSAWSIGNAIKFDTKSNPLRVRSNDFFLGFDFKGLSFLSETYLVMNLLD